MVVSLNYRLESNKEEEKRCTPPLSDILCAAPRMRSWRAATEEGGPTSCWLGVVHLLGHRATAACDRGEILCSARGAGNGGSVNQLKAQGPSRTCNKSKEEGEEDSSCRREFVEWGCGGRFDPTKSSSIKYIKHGQFFLQYADNSNLKGYEVSPPPPPPLDAPHPGAKR